MLKLSQTLVATAAALSSTVELTNHNNENKLWTGPVQAGTPQQADVASIYSTG